MTSSLLSRLQSLTEPSREIDAEIALANGWKRVRFEQSWRNPDGFFQPQPPRYTESLDVVWPLAKGYAWEVGSYGPGQFSGTCSAHIGIGPTPAIALLIARERMKEAMKAKEESKP